MWKGPGMGAVHLQWIKWGEMKKGFLMKPFTPD